MTTEPTSEPTSDDGVFGDRDDDLPGLTATLQRLVADGLGPAMGLRGDWARRSAIERVVRLGPELLARRLDAIYRAHHDSLVGCAAGVLGSRQDSEDVVNEAFARVLRADPDLDVPDALIGYVRSAVRNQALDRGSASTRDRASRQPQDPGDLEAHLASRDRPVADQVCDDMTLVVALHVLSERQRQCFALRVVGGLSVKDTAARLGVAEGNVKRICHDVRSRLAAALETST